MTPQEQLDFIGASNAITQLYANLRTNLIEQGWSERGAESAVLQIIQNAQNSSNAKASE